MMTYTLADLLTDLAGYFSSDTSKIVCLAIYFDVDSEAYQNSYNENPHSSPPLVEISRPEFGLLSFRVRIEHNAISSSDDDDEIWIKIDINESGNPVYLDIPQEDECRVVFDARDRVKVRDPQGRSIGLGMLKSKETRIKELINSKSDFNIWGINPRFIFATSPLIYGLEEEVQITKRIHLPIGKMVSEDYYRSELAEVKSELTKLKSDLALALGNSKQP
jgi:hypothetical protein